MNTARRRVRRLAREPRPPWRDTGRKARHKIETEVDARPKRAMLLAGGLTAACGLLAAGLVAAGLAAVYSAWAVWAWHRHRAHIRTVKQRHSVRHAIGLLSADLRAGAVPPATIGALVARLPAGVDPICDQIRHRLDAVRLICERTGAPVAQLLEHLAIDLRAQARVEALLNTHTAAATASSRLLAGLPLAGLALGQAIGAQPLKLLLHTPLGAACAAAAVGLQAAGMTWSRRILAGQAVAATPSPVASS